MGKVLCEIGDYEGLTQRTKDSWQTFVTRNKDDIRLTRRGDQESIPRRCVLIATTNELRPLPFDSSGWRRDLPILLGHAKGPVEPYLQKHRLQMWAEAKHRVLSGERANIPFDLRVPILNYISQFQYRDELVEEALQKLPPFFNHRTLSSLMIETGVIRTKSDIMRISKVQRDMFTDSLTALGCERIVWEDEHGQWIRGWRRQAKRITHNE